LIYIDIFEEIERKKMNQYSWYYILRDNLSQYGNIMKDFSERCEKIVKDEKIDQINKYLNIG
jgi:hypothetical protein